MLVAAIFAFVAWGIVFSTEEDSGGGVAVEEVIVDESLESDKIPLQQIPQFLADLTTSTSDTVFVTPKGAEQIFRGAAKGVARCDSGLYVVVEDGSKYADVATFFFEEDGSLLDTCQPFVDPEGCKEYATQVCNVVYEAAYENTQMTDDSQVCTIEFDLPSDYAGAPVYECDEYNKIEAHIPGASTQYFNEDGSFAGFCGGALGEDGKTLGTFCNVTGCGYKPSCFIPAL